MSSIAAQVTPATYIRFAASDKRTAQGIIPNQYKTFLMALLKEAGENAGDVLRAFRQAADLNASLKSTFFLAVHTSFDKLPETVNDQTQSWASLMTAIAEMSAPDDPMLKFARDHLLGKAVPTLVSSQTTDKAMQIASEIVSGAAASPYLAASLRYEWIRPVVMWHLKQADHHFEIAAPRFSQLRLATPFVPVIDEVEKKYGVHVDSEPLPHDLNKNLVFKFTEAHHGDVSVWIVDLSRPGRAKHPHEIPFEDAVTKYRPSVEKILLRASEYDGQKWVAPLATDRYCAVA